MKRAKQINDFYCGPAVLQMLYSFVGVEISQEEIVQAAGVQKKIKSHGIALEEMVLAVKTLNPDFLFWYKRNSTLTELSMVVNNFNYPVGVEWQGLFDHDESGEETEESETEDDSDPGHYSIITSVSTYDNVILIADPYKYYTRKDRKFTVIEFERRWWDINEMINPKTKKHFEIDDYQAMFVICPKEVKFPQSLGMING